jgi:hypothetical protein
MALGIMWWCLGHFRGVWVQDIRAMTPPDLEQPPQYFPRFASDSTRASYVGLFKAPEPLTSGNV